MRTYLTITHPSGTGSVTLDLPGAVLDDPDGASATLSLTIKQDFWRYGSEALSTNPLVYGALGEYYRGAQRMFIGKLRRVTRVRGSSNLVKAVFEDRLAELAGPLAVLDGNPHFTAQSPEIELTDIPLMLLAGTGGFDADHPYPVYPDFSTATDAPSSTSPWIAKSKSRASTLAADITGTPTTFEVTDFRNFSFPGFFQIDTELLWVTSGYIDSSNNHQLVINARGVLGTASADHSIGAGVYQRRLKWLSDSTPPELTADPSSTIVAAADYEVRETDGRFDFRLDPSALSSLVADFTCYDEDAAGGLTLAALATTLLTQTTANLGPGLDAGKIDVTALDDILISKVGPLESARKVLELLRQLADESWANGTGAARRLILYHSASTDKITFKSVTQAGSASFYFKHAQQVTATFDGSNLKSAAYVTHRTREPSSLLSAERIWHPAIGDNPTSAPNSGTQANAFDAIMYQDLERQGGYGWIADDVAAGNNVHTGRLLDGDPTTGWGIRCVDSMWATSDPGIFVCFAWFANVQVLDYAYLWVDLRNLVPSYFKISLVGLSSYTPGTPPAIGDVIPLGISYTVYAGADKRNLRPRRAWLQAAGSPGGHW